MCTLADPTLTYVGLALAPCLFGLSLAVGLQRRDRIVADRPDRSHNGKHLIAQTA